MGSLYMALLKNPKEHKPKVTFLGKATRAVMSYQAKIFFTVSKKSTIFAPIIKEKDHKVDV
jgi:hypothetical protein